MSGGAFDYACYVWDLGDLHEKRGSLRQVAEFLESLNADEFPGAVEAAKTTRYLIDFMEDFDKHMDGEEFAAIKEMWKSVEWWQSGDRGPDDARKALKPFFSK